MLRVTLVLLLSASMIGCGGDDTASAPDGSTGSGTQSKQASFATPAEAFAAFKAAAKSDDIETALRCMTPETQDAIAGIMTLPLAFMAAFDEEKGKEIKELFSRHGVDMEADSDTFPITTVEGKAEFLKEVQKYLAASEDGADKESIFGMIADVELGEITIDGDTATAPLESSEGITDQMMFLRIDGGWLVHIEVEMGMDGEEGGSVDFEMDTSGGFGAFEEKPPAPLVAMTSAELEESWKTGFRAEDVPAATLLESLASDLGLTLVVDPDAEELVETTVTLDLSDTSKIGVLLAICEKAGVVADFQPPEFDGPRLMISAGKEVRPFVLSGPFLIRFENFTTDPEVARGSASVRIAAGGLPDSVYALLNEDCDIELDVKGGSGEDVRHFGGGMAWSQDFSSMFHREIQVSMKNLLRKVETVSIAEGRIEFEIPTAIAQLQFDDLTEGAEKEAGEISAVLKGVENLGDQRSYSFQLDGVENEVTQVIAYDADGQAMTPDGYSQAGPFLSYDFSEPFPEKIVIQIVESTETQSFPFALTDIPVPNFGSNPEQLAELTFEGEQPVKIEFKSLGGEPNFRTLILSVTNHSNKSVEVIGFDTVYMDEGSKQLNERKAPLSYSGEAIPAGETAEIEVSAFFMPDETVKAEAEIRSVQFRDASEWQPE